MKISSKILTVLLSIKALTANGKVSAARKSAEAKLAEAQGERRLNPEYSCFGQDDFTVYFEGECSYYSLVERMEYKVLENERCVNNAAEEVMLLLGVMIPSSEDVAVAKVANICKTAMKDATDPNTKAVKWDKIANKGLNFDKEYYDGNTFWNEERQTDYDSIIPSEPSNVLKRDGERIHDLYETVAERVSIEFPEHLPNFESCELRSAMCCWVADRQANDNNGNCATPYDQNCIDKDPADNTDLCAVDMGRSGSTSNHISDGISFYHGDNGASEGAIHCHGMAWGQNEMEADYRYAGNNLFYISMYDHLYTRGYVRNVPGAPMCACTEDMPVVSRSDCTEIEAHETWKFEWNADTSAFTAELDRAEIDFNACRGDGGNNDLYKFYKRLYREGRASWGEYQQIQRTLVGNDRCQAAVEAMMFDKGYDKYYPPVPIDTAEGKLYSIKVKGGTNNGVEFLFTTNEGDVRLVTDTSDDNSHWRFVPVPGYGESLFNIRPKENANGLQSDETFLSTSFNGNVDMYHQDDESGRQKWFLKQIPGHENLYHIIISGGTSKHDHYLSTNGNGNPDLYDEDDYSGRQQWIITPLN